MLSVPTDQTDQRQVLPHDGSNSITGTGLIAAKCLWLLHESMMEGWQTIARSLGKKEESFITLCTGHFPVCCPACRVLCPLPLGKESRRWRCSSGDKRFMTYRTQKFLQDFCISPRQLSMRPPPLEIVTHSCTALGVLCLFVQEPKGVGWTSGSLSCWSSSNASFLE